MSDREKWDFLERAPERDALDGDLRTLVHHLTEAAFIAAPCSAERRKRIFAALAHALARDAITYRTDTARIGGEDIAGFTRKPRFGDALEALRRGLDDCDAKARLFVALCRAAGLPARMRPIWDGDGERLRHVFGEVTLEGKPYAVETILARARLGDEPYSVPTEKSGTWRYT